MFLTKVDLLTYIIPEELDEITRADDAIIDACIEAAIGEARSYLFDSFDVTEIFNETGTNRHALLIRIIANIALYDIVTRCQIGQEIAQRKARYDESVKWLKSVAKTETYADLPRRAETTQVHIKYGSNKKRVNRF